MIYSSYWFEETQVDSLHLLRQQALVFDALVLTLLSHEVKILQLSKYRVS